MRSKQTALVRDLVRLLTKYSARDWKPFIQLLTSDPAILEKALAARTAETKGFTKGKSRPKARPAPTKVGKTAAKGPMKLSKLKAGKAKPKTTKALSLPPYRSLLGNASISQLQTLYLRAYQDKRIPKSRAEISAALDNHLSKMPENERAAFLSTLLRNPTDSSEDFQRWADIITKGNR